MKKHNLRTIIGITSTLMLIGCGNTSNSTEKTTVNSENKITASEKKSDVIADGIVGVYSLDLSTVGMPLTIYLNLKNDSTFIFSNTTRFEVSKSEGTYTKSTEGYVMVYTSVNGVSKTTSDGLVSSFTYDEKNTITFTSANIYYGSTSQVTTHNAEDDTKVLTGVKMTDTDSGSEEVKSDFTSGYYTGSITSDGIEFLHHVTFFDDLTYLDLVSFENSKKHYSAEVGKYYLNGNQIAIESTDPINLEERLGGKVNSASSVTIGLVASTSLDKASRKDVTLTKSTYTKEKLFTFTGTTNDVTGNLDVYTDLSYISEVSETKETGYMSFGNTETNNSFKLYPDSSKDGSGLSHITSVPKGTVEETDGKIALNKVSLKVGNKRQTFTTMEEKQ